MGGNNVGDELTQAVEHRSYRNRWRRGGSAAAASIIWAGNPTGATCVGSARCITFRQSVHCHSGARKARTRNLEIPGSMLRIAPEW